MNPDLRTFVDRVVVPALVDRFLREHASAPIVVAPPVDLPKASATV